ncbi:hypothetical protein ACLX1H_010227 [Fusarium chlamydosporum]
MVKRATDVIDASKERTVTNEASADQSSDRDAMHNWKSFNDVLKLLGELPDYETSDEASEDGTTDKETPNDAQDAKNENDGN